MGYIGVSLILASFVWVIVAPPPWIHPFMPPFLLAWRNETKLLPPSSRSKSSSPPPPSDQHESKTTASSTTTTNRHAPEPSTKEQPRDAPPPPTLNLPDDPVAAPATAPAPRKTGTAVSLPPPPAPPVIRRSSPNPSAPAPPTVTEPEAEEQTTPKATPAAHAAPVPSFNLEEPSKAMAPPTLGAPLSSVSSSSGPTLGKGSMPPPPPPSTTSANMMPPPAPTPRGPVPPRLAAFPAMNSPQRARGPVPNRGPAPGSSSLGSSLAPPPTHSAKAPKPTRKVILTPGHSPLDWARISGPNADLRNLPPSTPYLKVTPSMLKKMTGRKGKDAWMALGGRVYNITPYLPYHPAGEPELLRGAGRDGTKLFGEIHPWVNYETMLSACLVGLLVDEEEGSKPSAMDEMD
ncbi:hypothetical protein CTAM01_06454 [Colletotrichum tamarilloi]|uniref:Cytochrome b5 heme-binding domain-containing protein n=1 Tax=Colletotrichum tamarilloi TaxID=1209934 RepID=A0ABQ9RBW1_9PEZI|nr:uncharacterized protein CTAM01_06454 [Colletotrichum tamarilloi]KAK1500519.1 hypothetical protein CTAM01_06454 [Colletotrichum tamarilloi]